SGNLYVGTDGGIFQSPDGATTFTDQLNIGVVSHLLYSVASTAVAPNVVLGGMQDNGTRLREGASSIFNEVIGGDGFGTAIHRSNAQLMLGSVYFDDILKSTDGGTSWNDAITGLTEANDGNNAPFFTKIVAWDGPGSNNLGNEVFTFSFTKVYRSTNFADSWAALPVVPVETNGELRNVAVAATDDKVIG